MNHSPTPRESEREALAALVADNVALDRPKTWVASYKCEWPFDYSEADQRRAYALADAILASGPWPSSAQPDGAVRALTDEERALIEQHRELADHMAAEERRHGREPHIGLTLLKIVDRLAALNSDERLDGWRPIAEPTQLPARFLAIVDGEAARSGAGRRRSVRADRVAPAPLPAPSQPVER